jgi:exopolysaccharide biosynthesis polyprenyl glycosylphosphotransferase
MSTDFLELPQTDVLGSESGFRGHDRIRPLHDLPSNQSLRLSQASRLREGSLSSRPFLLSSRAAWITLDFVLVLGAAIVAQIVPGKAAASLETIKNCALAGLPIAFLVLVLAQLSSLYCKENSASAFVVLFRILRAVVPAGLALYGLQKLWGTPTLYSGLIVREAILAATVMFLGRAIWIRRRDSLYKREIALRNFLIVGADEVGRDVRHYLTSLRASGYRFRGFVSMCEPSDDRPAVSEDEIVGEIHQVIDIARSLFADEIVFSRRPSTPGVLSGVLRQAQLLGISIRLIPSLTETLIDRTDVQYIGELPTISVFEARSRTLSLFVKRAIDIVLAMIALILLLPLFAAIAMVIKFESRGPVFYLSRRVGHKGRAFTCYKFRTMVEDADAMREQLAHMNERKGVLFKISNDPRITVVGAVLRKYSLDELPQLWNVVRGDMSLVGPRPPLKNEVAQYHAEHLRRLDAVPGITGLWQVEARQDPSFENYISLDSKYVNHWSLRMDLRILLRTVSAVIRGTGS